jgi:hypothetical protein
LYALRIITDTSSRPSLRKGQDRIGEGRIQKRRSAGRDRVVYRNTEKRAVVSYLRLPPPPAARTLRGCTVGALCKEGGEGKGTGIVDELRRGKGWMGRKVKGEGK